MSNEKYELENISDTEVELFSKYLGYGSPKDCDIWFMGREPTNREHLEGKKRYYLNNDYYYIDSLTSEIISWEGNKKIDSIAKELKLNIKDFFIGDFYFLPAKSGDSLCSTYGQKCNNRKEFYKNRFWLYSDLLSRMTNFFSYLKNNNNKKIVFFSDKNSLDIIKNNYQDDFKNIGKNIYSFNGNKILFTSFILNDDFRIKEVINFLEN